ncbi:MAG: thioredoxin domain-containing protein [bacterium]|nr:thioredoxin domain-containing protein [Gammaproteobacteria bacterium]HIL97299.1 thioredoxin domain-containing protein [Pseudomonadales bacterium]
MKSKQGPRHTNRLIDESSPYLIQHAHNPVNWFPWGEEAFDCAAREGKPVFLSIGYSTCHWCHVMERESFDSEEIAQYLNDHFISIKLDREQRPDLDDIYMTGVQLMTGHGGWPMSNFLTVEGKPFYAGTYYPPDGFMNLLRQIQDLWRNRREEVLGQAEQISESIAQYTSAVSDSENLDDDLGEKAVGELLTRFDKKQGGFGGPPKFPNESQLLLALEQYRRNDNQAALNAVCLTLDKIGQGGIYDQIAGGFHRYSVDEYWLVPHFEKMLYNQAQLVRVYCDAFGTTGSPTYRRIVEQTVDYLLRDMSDANGAFYSATDADSEGEEGRFFTWTLDELRSVLSGPDVEFIAKLYGVTAIGNFEGRNILHLAHSIEDMLSGSLKGFPGNFPGKDSRGDDWRAGDLPDRISSIHKKLYERRELRVHPLRDEKIITAWNGLMITALVNASWSLDRPDYLIVAEQAAEFIWRTNYSAAANQQHRLWRISYQGQVSIPGNLEDYACLAEATLTLHLYSGTDEWLTRGRRLVDDMLELFWDQNRGGFFLSLENDEGPLITRPKSPTDGAMPSGNATALAALVLLFQATGDKRVEVLIGQCLTAFTGLIEATPAAFATMIIAADSLFKKPNSKVQFCADGHVRVFARREGTVTRVTISISDSWHINSHVSSASRLTPTQVLGQFQVLYPPGEKLLSGFQHEALDVYRGDVELTIEGVVREVKIRLQACSEAVCLAVEELTLSL